MHAPPDRKPSRADKSVVTCMPQEKSTQVMGTGCSAHPCTQPCFSNLTRRWSIFASAVRLAAPYIAILPVLQNGLDFAQACIAYCCCCPA